ncbi:hypothetical protein SEA_EFFIE_410 [Acinetobacter phage Effie]|nr:hypothetical protein SEA_EFFIE_410 [Acinetobacter phage Effie]
MESIKDLSVKSSIAEKLEQIDNLFTELAQDVQAIDQSNVEEMVGKYIHIRNTLSASRKSFETFETQSKNIQDSLNEVLVQLSVQTGVDSFKTKAGTAFRKIKNAYRVDDWDAYVEWMKENDALHCVEKRPAKMAVEEIHNESGEVPAGLRFEQTIEFQFRKA